MGRHYYSKKDTVEDCLIVGVFWLKRNGYLDGYKHGGITWTSGSGSQSTIGITVSTCIDYKFLRFNYTLTQNEKKENYNYVVRIVTSRCNFKGRRFWFLCPLLKGDRPCERRVAKLYLPPGGKYFGCRQCYDLSYNTRNKYDGRFAEFGKVLDYEAKMEKLKDVVKRKYYNGRMTKKYKRYLQCVQEFNHAAPLLAERMNRLLSN